MPRAICQHCEKGRIVYRLYPGVGQFRFSESPQEICKKCAIEAVQKDGVFNLRFIRRQDLGTAPPPRREDDPYDYL